MRPILKSMFILICVITVTPSFACNEQPICIETGSWQLGAAIGLGVRTNPLVDGDNIPLVLLPDIAWYGEKAYFDNGELGYQWLENASVAVEGYLSINRESGFFSFWHPSNLLMPTGNFNLGSIDSPAPDNEAGNTKLSKDDVASRKWALDAGIRWHFRIPYNEWAIAVQSDVSGVHNGQQLILSYKHNWQWNDWHLSMIPTLVWKSDNLVDYYYGLSARDNVDSSLYYQGQGGWLPGIQFSSTKVMSQNWQWLFQLSYQSLHSGMRDSPLVEKDNISSLFFGMAYTF